MQPSTDQPGSPGGRKPTNPYKKHSPKDRNSSKKNKAVQHVIKGYRFGSNATFELYNYSVGSPALDWKDGYTLNLRQFVDGDKAVPELEDLGICGYYFMRVRYEVNQSLRGSDNWPRFNIIRVLPDGSFSTPNSLEQGMTGLKNYFMNSAYSLYPPSDITCIDATNSDAPLSLDRFICDVDVPAVLRMVIEPGLTTDTFATDYPDVASMFYGGPIYPQTAVQDFGYGIVTPRVVGLAPGFVLPPAHAQQAGVIAAANEAAVRAQDNHKQDNDDGHDAADEDGTATVAVKAAVAAAPAVVEHGDDASEKETQETPDSRTTTSRNSRNKRQKPSN